ncbi:MAG: pilus assembly protein PilM [Butyrivibrio sp.]|nr:pilus assembly protein PilM [Butyrivibrio sp.]
MASRVLSIEIGYSLTRVCEVSYNTKTPKVFKSFTVQTVEGVMNDGAIQVDSHYVQAINDAIREHKIKTRKVVFSITSTKIATREVVIPFVKENRIKDVVRANASDYFPVDLSEYELAYTILETIGEKKGGQQYKLLVLAIPASILEGYYALASAMRMEVVSIDYVGNSLYQVVKGECATGTHLIAKIDERSTMIMVVKDQTIAFTRNVGYGVEDALQAVMESVAWGNIRSIRQAVGIVEKYQCIDLSEGEDAAGAGAPLSVEEAAQRNVTDALVPVVNGIVRVIDYYASRNSDSPIEEVMLTGMGANFLGMAELLSREVHYPVKYIKRISGLNLEKFFKDKFFGEYLACIGASMGSVGFKKREESKSGKSGKAGKKGEGAPAAKGDGNKFIVIGALFLVACLAAAGGMTGYSMLTYMEANVTNVELNHTVKEMMPIMDVYNDYLDVQTKYDIAEAMYSATESQNDSLYEFFVELEQKLPSDVSVVSFNTNWTQITISMQVSTKSEAAATVEQLRTFKSLIPTSVTVASITETESDDESNTSVVEFSVTAAYMPIIHGVDIGDVVSE